jgi:hypothetical protein
LACFESAEQDRFRAHDPHLQESLHEHYDYMIKYLDPVLSPAIEQALLYQPDQIADFLANTVRGTLDPSKYNYVVRLDHLHALS